MDDPVEEVDHRDEALSDRRKWPVEGGLSDRHFDEGRVASRIDRSDRDPLGSMDGQAELAVGVAVDEDSGVVGLGIHWIIMRAGCHIDGVIGIADGWAGAAWLNGPEPPDRLAA